jgi:sec-independent protein translocase protein TatC
VDSSVNSQNLERFMPFILEIRRRLLFLLSLFVVVGAVGFFNYEKIVSFVLQFFALDGVNIVLTSPFQFLNLAVSSAIFVATIITFPLIVYQILSFLKPALDKKEFRAVMSLLPLSIGLFLGGFVFGVVLMRYVITLFYQNSQVLDVGNILDISDLISQILTTSLALGLAFQFPIVITLLIRLGIVKYQSFVKFRYLAYIFAFIFSALLPPTDVLSLILMALPLIGLFELTLVFNKTLFKK